ncbi:hypothetical protein GP486_003868 [Trichoglossum hirsutum]|uniref:Uncharacterized protein n=1 Tax=Trichoglossum hirsutum TaxID=265104 RepID=A0A9P8RQ25_9PEZI|nr:hypothetical protein GP486_003868 [Trichoglossum hirsutum]
MEKLICVVIPPYFSRSHEEYLRGILLTEFGSNSSGMRFVIQPQAALANCAEEERKKIGRGDLVTVCHMEEEITTISQFIVKNSLSFELQQLRSSIVVLGSFDIAERFQGYLEQRLERAIALTEGGSGDIILDEIIKSVRCRIADDSTAGIRSSRLTIGVGDMREKIFYPVLAAIFDKLDPVFHIARGKRYVLFSGVLGECPYVHSYMKERFDTTINTEILETFDESTSSCQGAIFLLDEQRDVAIQRQSHEQPIAVHTTSESRLERIRAIQAELDNERRTTRSQSGFLRKYEMILAERISRQGYDSPDTKAAILSIEAIHREIGSSDQSMKRCTIFADGYTYEMKHRIDPTDKIQQFSAMHLAAASNDYLALRIILTAGYSVHGLVEDRPLGHFDHTPLHIYAWYNNDPNECLDLLINAGAVALSVVGKTNQSPAHVAASKGHHQLLKAFERRYGERFLEECPGLLQLAIAEGQRVTVKYLIEIGASVSSERTWMYFSPLTGACYREILPPLCSALEHAWTDVATLIINKNLASSHDNGMYLPLLHSIAMGQEAMIRLLIRWADMDTDGKDELGQTQLSWAARLGYEVAVQLLVDWEQVVVDSRDIYERTPLWWAASRGHEAVVRLLLEKGADVNAEDKSKYGLTALYSAASRGHEAVVRLLALSVPQS